MATSSDNKFTNEKVAIIGSGLIGGSFAMLFAAAGYRVTLYDIDQSLIDKALANIHLQLQELQEAGLLRGTLTVEEQHQLISGTTDLEACLSQAVYLQECVPELRGLKQDVWKKIDTYAHKDIILASSSSTMPCSTFTGDLINRAQCLVAHPINPPYYCPLIEVVPAPFTKPEVTKKAMEILKYIGQSPVHLKKEVAGFAVNRVQYALLNECWRLIEDDIISVDDMDKVFRDGLGMRYAFMGPMETIHLNAEGVVDYCTRYGKAIQSVSQTFGDVPQWGGSTATKIDADMQSRVPETELGKRRQWRDACLAQLSLLKQRMDNKKAN